MRIVADLDRAIGAGRHIGMSPNKGVDTVGLFSKKPVLPDYREMPVEERMTDLFGTTWCSRVPGFSNVTLVANADGGHIMGAGGLTNVEAGILTVTPDRVGYAYSGKHEISQITQPVHKADLRHNGDMFIIMFGSTQNAWSFFSDDHSLYLEAFRRARSLASSCRHFGSGGSRSDMSRPVLSVTKKPSARNSVSISDQECLKRRDRPRGRTSAGDCSGAPLP
jgi:hypothetical protein